MVENADGVLSLVVGAADQRGHRCCGTGSQHPGHGLAHHRRDGPCGRNTERGRNGIADGDGLTNAATGKAVWRAPPNELPFYSEAVRDEGIELSWSSDSDSTETEYMLYRRVLRHEKGSARPGPFWIGRGVDE